MQAASTVWLHLRFGCHFSGFHTQFSLLGLGLGLRVFTWRTNPLTAARPQLSLSLLLPFISPSLSLSQFDSERNGQLHVLIAACNCPATATQLLLLPLGSACVAVAVAVAAAAVLRWLCTCDNIFIIFASFLLLPLLRCHRHWHRRIANGRCVCKH